MTFLYQKSRCLIEAFSLHLKHLLLFLPTTMYEGSKNNKFTCWECYVIKQSIQKNDELHTCVIHHFSLLSHHILVLNSKVRYYKQNKNIIILLFLLIKYNIFIIYILKGESNDVRILS